MDYFAHAGHAHETANESVWSSITGEWYVALPLYILFLAVLVAATYFVSHRSKAAAIMVLMTALLIGGVAFYSTSAVVSVMSLVTGFALALSLMVVSLSGGRHPHKKS